jgi:thiol-disulfide isomerase/thioredoxin
VKPLVIALLLGFTILGCGRTSGDVDLNAVGITEFPGTERVPAPEIIGPSLETGDTLAVNRGSLTVVNAWASWCAPCLTEMPILIKANRDYPDVQFIGLNVQDDDLNARQFVEDLGINFDSIQDPEGAILATIPGVPPRALPSTIIIDDQGRIAARIIGPVEEQQLTEILDRLTREG